MKAKRGNFPRGKGIYLEYDLLNCKSFEEFTRSEITVLLVFYLKRQFPGKKGAQKMKVNPHTVVNNGQILFPYSEAEHFGMNKATFTRARDKLIRVGFIEIAGSSQQHSQSTLYKISERWKIFGTAAYEVIERPKTKNGVGVRSRFKPTALL